MIALVILSVSAANIYICCANNCIQAPSDSIICWQENVKLHWHDFKAKKNPLENSAPLYNIHSASTATRVVIAPVIDSIKGNNIVFSATFEKYNSWSRDSSATFSTILLAHEQLHFDICELIVRRARELTFHAHQRKENIFAPEFRKKIDCILQQEIDIDEKYDRETSHGTLSAQQKKWATYIKAELFKLNTFKSTSATCQQ